MTEAEVRKIIEQYTKEQQELAVSDWAASYWNEAVSNGVFDGTMPRGNITREQAAITYGKMGLLELSQEKDVSTWAKEAWDLAVNLGVVDGTSPCGPLTREQFVVVLSKLGLLKA